MDLKKYYGDRIEYFYAQSKLFSKKSKIASLLRVLFAVSTVLIIPLLWKTSFILAISGFIIFLTAFIFSIIKDSKLKEKSTFFSLLKKVNDLESSALEGDFSGFQGGLEYINKHHQYTSDLDIFGDSSLFRLICRSSGSIAKNILAEWLKTPASLECIHARQTAISELKGRIEWRQSMYAHELKNPHQSTDLGNLYNWLKTTNSFLERKSIVYMSQFMPYITVPVVAGYFIFSIHPVLPLFLLFIQFFLNFFSHKKITSIHNQLSMIIPILKMYSAIIELTEKEKFDSPALTSLQSKLFVEGKPASWHISYLAKILEKLDYRYNPIAHFPFNLLLLWDIQNVIKLEKWKIKNINSVNNWFDSTGELIVYSFLANLHFNNPDWKFPLPSKKFFSLNAKNLGHPLIKEQNRVCNDVEITGTGKVVLITGSNMAGKSTFLRTVGINLVLANTGAPVCAEKFEFSPSVIFTSMRVNDSLEENISSFYAELARLKEAIGLSEKGEKVIFLLDEILKGTNSNDRHIGSKALINQFINNNSTAIIATHDLTLTSMADTQNGRIENYHFDVQVNSNDELFFSYKLHNGVCKSLNASLLMKKMGIKL